MTGVRIGLGRLERVLSEVNDLRAGADGVGRAAGPPRQEELLDRLFDASSHLVVYGSLVPGGDNHHLLEDVPGTWREGWVTGQLRDRGWGAAAGYPALRWIPVAGEGEAPRVPAHLLASQRLASLWDRLDRFEGPGYRRILVPFFAGGGDVAAVGNLYELDEAG